MTRQPPTSTLFPYTTLFRSFAAKAGPRQRVYGAAGPRRLRRRVAEDAEDVETAPTRAAAEVRAGSHDAADLVAGHDGIEQDRKSTRLNSSHSQISYAVFCLK